MEKIKIGRSPENAIVISDSYDTVSNDHADITLENGVLTFIDHSTNGTIINGQKVKGQSVTIHKGDTISLANVYTLSWDIILQHFPQLSRSTVLQQDDVTRSSRETMSINEINYEQEGYNGTRETQQFTSNIEESAESFTPAKIKINTKNKKLIYIAVAAILFIVVFASILFNDLIYNII